MEYTRNTVKVGIFKYLKYINLEILLIYLIY